MFRRNRHIQGAQTNVVKTYSNSVGPHAQSSVRDGLQAVSHLANEISWCCILLKLNPAFNACDISSR
jgi:hypothetical protein